jgi:hypothetical protein
MGSARIRLIRILLSQTWREVPLLNSPDRLVGGEVANQDNEARRANLWDVHAGPSDLLNRFQHRNHDLTVVAIE